MGVLPKYAMCCLPLTLMKTAENALLRFSLPFLGQAQHPAFENLPFWGLPIVRNI